MSFYNSDSAMMNESNAEEMIDPRVAEREKMESELKKLNEKWKNSLSKWMRYKKS